MTANRPRECWIGKPDNRERISGRLAESLQTEEHSDTEHANICHWFVEHYAWVLENDFTMLD
jgi:hypothetical protein